MTSTASAPKLTEAPTQAPDLAALKTRQQAAWSSGNYAIVGATLQIVGEELCEAMDLKSGAKVLDVAAGNGMASLAAARRWCDVTSTDYVPALLEHGRARAAAEGMTIVVSSHILAELEDYCTQMLMIRDGQVAGGGVVAAGGAISDQTLIEVSFTDPPSDLLARLTALGLKTAANTASSAVLHLGPGQTESDLIAILIGAGLKVRAFGPARNSLEAAYLAEAKR